MTQSRQHPVQLWSDESKAKAMAVALHGDEGTSKRSKSVLVVSISPLGVHRGDSLLQKYPFCVPWLTVYLLAARLFVCW